MTKPEDYNLKARETVALEVNKNLEELRAELKDVFIPGEVTADDFYVVWFCKALQNWKALVSTDVVHGYYFEVTHNGDRAETYVDTYTKESNATVADTEMYRNHDLFHLTND